MVCDPISAKVNWLLPPPPDRCQRAGQHDVVAGAAGEHELVAAADHRGVDRIAGRSTDDLDRAAADPGEIRVAENDAVGAAVAEPDGLDPADAGRCDRPCRGQDERVVAGAADQLVAGAEIGRRENEGVAAPTTGELVDAGGAVEGHVVKRLGGDRQGLGWRRAARLPVRIGLGRAQGVAADRQQRRRGPRSGRHHRRAADQRRTVVQLDRVAGRSGAADADRVTRPLVGCDGERQIAGSGRSGRDAWFQRGVS